MKEQLECFRNFIDSPLGLLSNQITKKGISERYFAERLKAKLNYQVIENSKFGYYFPDFIIFNSEHHVYMNVEIDEPYEFETGLPIHCMNDDDSRDDYFLRNGFIVLRFSEFQIIEKTDSCIELIKSTFENFLNFKPVNENMSPFYGLVEECWNEEKAKELYTNDYRKKLLEKIFSTGV